MSEHDGRTGKVPPPQGHLAGLPYDWRRPSAARIRSRMWNPGDPRVLTPKSFGLGLTLNFYWLVHPVRLAWARRCQG